MAKHVRLTAETVARRMSQGRGVGEGQNYRPVLHGREFPSFGYAHDVWGIRQARTHYYASEGEYWVHHLVEFDPTVVRFEEQFVLPLDETQEIAEGLGVKHPAVRGEPTVVTTDFRLARDRVGKRVDAVEVKDASGMKNGRTLEKLEIQRAWWEAQGHGFHVLVKETIDWRTINNLQWLSYAHLHRSPADTHEAVRMFALRFQRRYGKSLLLSTILSRVERDLGIDRERALRRFQIAVWARLIRVDLRWAIRLGHPVRLTTRRDLGVVTPW